MRIALLLAVTAFAISCTDDAPSLASLADAHVRHGKTEMHAAIPILRVDSLKQSQAYFRDMLGFKVEWEDGDPPDFGAVSRGDAVFFLCQRCQSTTGAWAFVFTKDVDKLHDELRGRGARVLMPPKTMPWKLREMHVADRDGNTIRFASPVKHD